MAYLDETLSINKGFVMEPTLEDRLGIIKTGKKVENAFNWASSDVAKQKLLILESVKSFLNNT